MVSVFLYRNFIINPAFFYLFAGFWRPASINNLLVFSKSFGLQRCKGNLHCAAAILTVAVFKPVLWWAFHVKTAAVYKLSRCWFLQTFCSNLYNLLMFRSEAQVGNEARTILSVLLQCLTAAVFKPALVAFPCQIWVFFFLMLLCCNSKNAKPYWYACTISALLVFLWQLL